MTRPREYDLCLDKDNTEWKSGGRCFEYPVVVLIGDTNMAGTVYWVNFFKWLGQAREAFIVTIVPNLKEAFAEGLRIVTVETQLTHMRPAFFLDELVIRIRMEDVQRASAVFQAVFVSRTTGDLFAQARQRIAFTSARGKPIRMPEVVRTAALEYAVSENNR